MLLLVIKIKLAVMMIIKKWQAMTVLVAFASLLVGCDNLMSSNPHTKMDTTAAMSIDSMPSAAVVMGKTKATEQFIARQWQVVSMNDRPVGGDLVLDLTDFRSGKGEFRDGCERILVTFNTNDLSDERLLIDRSARKSRGCHSELIDKVMWTLSDVYAFKRNGNELNIIAVQNMIRLVPVKQPS